MTIRHLTVVAFSTALIACAGATPADMGPEVGDWGVDLSARDESVNPGDDFHEYANGTWLSSFDIPADLSAYGVGMQLALEAEADVHAIVEDLAASNPAPGSLEQKVGDYYASWMDVARVEELGATPLAPHLAEIAAIQSKAELMRAFGRPHIMAPFGVGIIPDPADTTRYVAFVTQSGLGLPDRDYYLSEDARFVEYRAGYRDYMVTVMGLAGIGDAETKADAIMAFETRIAEIHWPVEDTRDIQKIYNPMPPAQVAELAPEIDWTAVFDEMGLGGVETFVVAETTAIDKGAELVESTSLGVLKDYIAFHFIRATASLLSSDFDTAHFEFFSKMLQGNEEQRERWKRGIQRLNTGMGEAVGQIYVQRHFPPETKAQLDALVGNLVVAMEDRLRQNEWMDDATRAQALAKLETFEPRIGYPSKWIDYGPLEVNPDTLLENALAMTEFGWQLQVDRLGGPVDRELWDMSPQEVNAYYNPLLNQITFPAAILQPPFFDPNADPAVNYGAIGAVIGHEIGHGFDDQGRRFDEQGRIRDWWTAEADANFSGRTSRLGAQYDAYQALPDMSVNGQFTMGENIGDLGGVEMAYAAYHRFLDETSNGEAPVIDGLTGDQRFFLSYAQAWRSKIRDDALRSRLVSDPHSPPKFRVNGVVRNLDAWYDAFGITEGDALYLPPAERVRIW